MKYETSLYFTHFEHEWKAEIDDRQRHFFEWRKDPSGTYKEPIQWDWKNCNVSAKKLSNRKIRVLIRCKHPQFSSYRGRKIQLRFIYSFDTSTVNQIEFDESPTPKKKYPEIEKNLEIRQRVGIKLVRENESNPKKQNCWIWQWDDGQNTEIKEIHEMLQEKLSNNYQAEDDVEIFEDNEVDQKAIEKLGIVPIIYQPAIDSWDYFIRQIHCNKINDNLYEITIIFNDEKLRQHRWLDPVYRLLRLPLYGRLKDVESFRVYLDNGNATFYTFKGIYSNDDVIYHDSTHGDRAWIFPLKKRKILYFVFDRLYPKVFINTSNHAMAEKDNNRNIWKWEYIPLKKELSPVYFGTKSRKQIEDIFKLEGLDSKIKKFREILKQRGMVLERIPEKIEIYHEIAKKEFVIDQNDAENLVNSLLKKK